MIQKLLASLCFVLFLVGSIMLKENLEFHEEIDAQRIKLGAVLAATGLVGMLLFRKTLRNLIPLSDKEIGRLKEVEKIRLESKREKINAREARRSKRKAKLILKALRVRQKKLNDTLDRRIDDLKISIDQYSSTQNLPIEMAENVKANIVERRLDVMKYGQGLTLNHVIGAQLVITIPINTDQKYSSWQGGNPYLPDDIDWPIIDDEPCNFYAQIYCPDLPDGIWGGLGPKTGWLSFFCSPRDFGKVKILHTKVLGKERCAPADPNHYRGYGDAREDYNEAVGDTSNLAPKWPIVIKPTDLSENLNSDKQVEPPKQKDNPYEVARNYIGKNLRAEHYLPFNRLVFEKMMTFFQTYIDKQTSAEAQARFLSYKNLDWTPYVRARLHTKHSFELLKSKIENSLSVNGFSRSLVINFVDGLSKIETADWWPEHMKDSHSILSLATEPVAAYRKFLEVYLRISYSRDKSAIPTTHLMPWETYWSYLVEPETGQCGGHIRTWEHRMCESYVRLLELPCSQLMGWEFGDVGAFGVFISPSDLEAGNWDAAFGDIWN